VNRLAVEEKTLGVLRWVVIAILLAVTVFPFYYMVVLSFVPIQEMLLHPTRIYVTGSDFTFSTYRQVLESVSHGGQGFLGFIRNSGLVALATVLATLVVSIPGAYAVARLDFFARRQISGLFLAVYLFPAIVLAIPLFVAFAKLQLTESLVGLVLVYIVLTVPVSIHMLRQYFETIPASIEEAAAIDGAGRVATLVRITMPLALPAIMSTALYIFMIAWNEFLFALLFLTPSRNLWTVSLGLSQLTNGLAVPKTVLMAGSVILTLPIVILYGLAERTLVSGLTAGADKG
jgi:multiple sugar transport system permease protein